MRLALVLAALLLAGCTTWTHVCWEMEPTRAVTYVQLPGGYWSIPIWHDPPRP